ncbi:putative signal transducing protein [Flavobacterium sp. 3-218]
MIEIFRGSYIETMNIKNLLENNGISAFITNEYMSNIQPWSVSAGGNSPAILKVLEKDMANSKKIIESYNNGEYNLSV